MPPTQAQVGRTAGTLLAPDGSLIVVGDGGLVRLRLDGSTLTSRTMSVPARTFGVVALHDAVDVTATQYDAEMRPIGMSVMTCDWAASDCAVDPSASSEWLRSYAQPNGDLAYEINFKDDTRLRIFDPTNEQDPPIELKVRPGTWRVFVPNHRRWAAVVPFLDHEFDVYDLATGERIATLPKNQFVWLNGPPDGRYLLILDTQGDSTYVDTTAWTVSESPLEAGGWLDSAFSPDGRLALTLGNDGAIVLRDADTLKPIRNFSGSVAAGASWMAFSDDSRHALIAGSGRAQVWDVATGVALGNPNGSAAPTAAFSVVEGQVPTLALVTGDQLVLTRFDVEAWPDMACHAAGRNMTLDEWERYGPTGEPYHPTCTQWPSADA